MTKVEELLVNREESLEIARNNLERTTQCEEARNMGRNVNREGGKHVRAALYCT